MLLSPRNPPTSLAPLVFPDHVREKLDGLKQEWQDVFVAWVRQPSFEQLRRRPTLVLLVLELARSGRIPSPEAFDLIVQVAIEASASVRTATLRAFLQQPALPWADLRLWQDADVPRVAVVRVLFAHLVAHAPVSQRRSALMRRFHTPVPGAHDRD